LWLKYLNGRENLQNLEKDEIILLDGFEGNGTCVGWFLLVQARDWCCV
jgi:hypothetical protein